MHRYSVRVLGRVQGVGFRYFVDYTAKSLNLTGWVKNCYDGSVELEVQGEEENISTFMQKIKTGNRFAKVNDMYSEKIEPIDTEKSFRVVY